MNEKRYYWLKLEENYFDLKVQKALRKLPSGADMLICYLKMQLKYINKGGYIEHQGICDSIIEEIALDIDEDEDIVKMTTALLIKWKVIEEEDNKNLYLLEMQDRIGSKSDVAIRVAKHREKQKMLQCNNDVTKCNSIKDIDIEIDKDIDKEKINKKEKLKKPTKEEVEKYCIERKNNIDAETFIDFYESKGWKVGNSIMKDWKACIRTWEKRNKTLQKKEIKPKWIDQDIKDEPMTEEEIKEFERLLAE